MTISLLGRRSFLLVLSTTPRKWGGSRWGKTEGLSCLASTGQTARTKNSETGGATKILLCQGSVLLPSIQQLNLCESQILQTKLLLNVLF